VGESRGPLKGAWLALHCIWGRSNLHHTCCPMSSESPTPEIAGLSPATRRPSGPGGSVRHV